MKSKKRNRITLRLDDLLFIKVDIQAELLGVNRSEFIYKAIEEKIARCEKISSDKEKLSDFEKMIETLKEVNSNVLGNRELMRKGFLYGQKALVELNPDKAQSLLKIFNPKS